MDTVTLSDKYQVAIPKRICEAVGAETGSAFEMIVYNNRIELIPVKPLKALNGIFRGIDTSIIRDDDRI